MAVDRVWYNHMRTVIADSNALLMPFKTSINLDSELRRLLGTCRIVVPAPIIGELKKLEKTLPHAKSALRLARTKDIIETDAQGDKAVLEAAEMLDAPEILCALPA